MKRGGFLEVSPAHRMRVDSHTPNGALQARVLPCQRELQPWPWVLPEEARKGDIYWRTRRLHHRYALGHAHGPVTQRAWDQRLLGHQRESGEAGTDMERECRSPGCAVLAELDVLPTSRWISKPRSQSEAPEMCVLGPAGLYFKMGLFIVLQEEAPGASILYFPV